MALSLDSVGVAAPFCAAGVFGATYFSTPSTDTSKSGGRSKALLYASIALSSSITATFALQSGLHIYTAVNQKEETSRTTDGVQALLGTLLWLTLTLLLLVQPQPTWRAYAAAAVINAILELPVITQSFHDFRRHTNVRAVVGITIARVVLLFGLFGTCAARSKIPAPSAEDETQPLLGSRRSSDTSNGSAHYSVPKDEDSESDSDDDEPKRLVFSDAHKKAVQEKGGIVGYLAQFKVFMPYLWPSGDRRLQAYFGVIGLNILAERALNVLYPRQFGIVVDKLYRVASEGGPIPIPDILLWTLYYILVLDACGLPAVSEILETRIANRTRLRLSVAAFDHVMGLPMSFHDGKASGELIKAVEQAGSMSSLLRMLIMETAPFLLDIIVALWYVFALLGVYGPIIVLYVAVTFAFVTYTIAVVMRKARRSYAADSRAESQVLYETISNWSTVSFFNRHRHEHGRIYSTASTAIKSSQWDNDVSIYLFAAQQVVEIGGRLATSLLAAYRIAMGLTPVGNFVAIEVYWDSITRPLWHLSYNFRQVSSNLIDAERLLELFQQTSNIKDGPQTLPASVSGQIEFSNVQFGYSVGQLTLNNVSFVAKPGQTIAIVGETGGGKSTMLKLLMRFYDVTSGSIKVDGVDIRDATVESVREAFGFVPQNAVLFNASILENVRYGRLDATDEEVHEACRAAAIHDRIMGFPARYDTKTGERGVKLSGGELQRIAIARVMLRKPQVVLLDEATSALDTETESKIQDALRALTTGRTTIVIAHRLSTIVDADLILMVNQGQIIERGSHASLLQQGGKYKDYWSRQTRTHDSAS